MSQLPYRIEVKETSDGSRTLYVPEIGEHYHSVHGARTESTHIFIDHALRERWGHKPLRERYTVVEIGFGTGLNALLTYLQTALTTPRSHITYHTYEKYPIDVSLVSDLFSGLLSSSELELCITMHQAEWDVPVEIAPFFTLHKHLGDVTTVTIPPYDVVYMDAFSPENAPDLWSETFLAQLSQAALPSATFSTYCAKGAIRRALQAMGWQISRTPGPPGGKREILTARRSPDPSTF